MSVQPPINIYEHRLGNAPSGFWRYVYDAYPSGKPVEEATEDQGRAAFAAYRSQAPDTVPIYRHNRNHEQPNPFSYENLWTPEEETPVWFELDDQSSAADRPNSKRAYVPDSPPQPNFCGQVVYGDTVRIRLGASVRAFWAFPATSSASAPSNRVAVYEHRLEVDVLATPSRSHQDMQTFLRERCMTYIRYTTSQDAGRVFDKDADSRELSTPGADWWRMTTKRTFVSPYGGGGRMLSPMPGIADASPSTPTRR